MGDWNMKNAYKPMRNILEPILIIIELVLIIIFTSCYSSELRVSEFEFLYNDQNYIIRSAYCPNNPESCNQLISNKFVAVDLNQDRIIDKISDGDVDLAEAQEIYDYSLNLLQKMDKLNEVNRENNNYVLNEVNYDFEIKTFHPKLDSPFNEFTITDKQAGKSFYKVSILIDKNADGKLNELLKGGMLIDEAQIHYDMVIQIGLTNKDLKKINDSILIK
jgi:hypothetical protein